jgi:hypothetical protein
MRDDALARFTEHQLPREALHALMARSDGPALLRTAWHLGMLALAGTLLGENMRTTLTLAPVRLFAWNMPYHSDTPTRRCPSTRCPACTSRCGAGSSTWSRVTWRPPSR